MSTFRLVRDGMDSHSNFLQENLEHSKVTWLCSDSSEIQFDCNLYLNQMETLVLPIHEIYKFFPHQGTTSQT